MADPVFYYEGHPIHHPANDDKPGALVLRQARAMGLDLRLLFDCPAFFAEHVGSALPDPVNDALAWMKNRNRHMAFHLNARVRLQEP